MCTLHKIKQLQYTFSTCPGGCNLDMVGFHHVDHICVLKIKETVDNERTFFTCTNSKAAAPDGRFKRPRGEFKPLPARRLAPDCRARALPATY